MVSAFCRDLGLVTLVRAACWQVLAFFGGMWMKYFVTCDVRWSLWAFKFKVFFSMTPQAKRVPWEKYVVPGVTVLVSLEILRKFAKGRSFEVFASLQCLCSSNRFDSNANKEHRKTLFGAERDVEIHQETRRQISDVFFMFFSGFA